MQMKSGIERMDDRELYSFDCSSKEQKNITVPRVGKIRRTVLWNTKIFQAYRWYRSLRILLKKDILPPDWGHFTCLLEKAIRCAYQVDKAYLCLYDPKIYIDNIHSYYSFTLMNRGASKNAHTCFMHLNDAKGEPERVFYFPIHSHNRNFGAFIIPVNIMNRVNRFVAGERRAILKLFSLAVIHFEQRLQRDHSRVLQQICEVRKSVAQDIHDDLAQRLFYLAVQSYHLKNMINSRCAPDKAVTELLEKIDKQINGCHGEVRRLIQELHSPIEGNSRIESLETLLGRIMEGSRIHTEFSVQGQFKDDDYSVYKAIYRIVEEASYNVVKHARAKNLKVQIERTTVQWEVHIVDDGVGMEEDSICNPGKGYGLRGIRERVLALKGSLTIRSQIGEGTEIVVIFPRRSKETYEYDPDSLG
ncbi:hypothetical protein GJ688_13530 [Heliobacillus mobilis]|uniref:histidine kinase n=1 Tax=Heliobacterium mobile TaxID=28064 RepID=A0A6I3SMJ2_HELMO|nr:sensor histidine kinase [Heliobacterium mobile]MTV49996.1 hypothetical protein [Heliobacterium mobile]